MCICENKKKKGIFTMIQNQLVIYRHLKKHVKKIISIKIKTKAIEKQK